MAVKQTPQLADRSPDDFTPIRLSSFGRAHNVCTGAASTVSRAFTPQCRREEVYTSHIHVRVHLNRHVFSALGTPRHAMPRQVR